VRSSTCFPPRPTRPGWRITLIDNDQEALAFVRAEVERHGWSERVHLHHANLVHLALGRQEIGLSYQDLIYSVGLIDYFEDALVTRLMDYGWRCLAPGGELLLGNFHPRNPDKAIMDHILDWRLIHRDEAQMDRLFQRSSFGRPCTSQVLEAERVNLFASCLKH
jgi:SAM-dependent methyltransferase